MHGEPFMPLPGRPKNEVPPKIEESEEFEPPKKRRRGNDDADPENYALNFAITGQFFYLRPYIRLAALRHGYHCFPIFNKNCGFLLVGADHPTKKVTETEKYKSAVRLGIPIHTLDDHPEIRDLAHTMAGKMSFSHPENDTDFVLHSQDKRASFISVSQKCAT